MAYEAGLEAEPNSEPCKKGLNEVQKAMDTDTSSPFGPGGGGGDMGLGKIFNDPGMMAKLESNPKTKGFMADPQFRAKVQQLQASGGTSGLQEMMGDPRMLTVLGVMMGIDIVSPCSWRIS